ncbi:type II toxin-antitoxin system RelE family toxin [Spirosoma pomorum]
MWKGDYRVIYEIQDELLVIEAVALGHRRQIYERVMRIELLLTKSVRELGL